MLYGFPGSGKSFFARQMSEVLNIAHLHSDRIRSELFENPTFNKQENAIVEHLMEYMAEEFLRTGVSVIYDMNAARVTQRRAIRDIARRHGSESLIVWLQVNTESAYARAMARDRRKTDDKYAAPIDRAIYDTQLASMQNPKEEDYVVISGMHTFASQQNSVMKKLHEYGLLSLETVSDKIVKPELVNLVPKINPGGRVDMSRRNIVIR